MSVIEVHIELDGALKRVGTLRRQARRGGEATTFEYHTEEYPQFASETRGRIEFVAST